MNLSREQINKGFREGVHDKEKLIAVTSSAIALLVLALIVQYGITHALKQSKALRSAKNDLIKAIKTDDEITDPLNHSAAELSVIVLNHFHELADKVDKLNWSDHRIQLLQFLPNLLRHKGPKEG